MTFEIDEDDYLAHYGTPRHSGRYPYGSGGEEDGAAPRNKSFLDHVEDLRRQGLTETQVAEGLGITTTQLRVQKSIEKNRLKQEQIDMAQRLKTKGYSNVEIGKRMGVNESSVRALLAPGETDKLAVLHTTAQMLREQVAQKDIIDIGSGVENHIGVSSTRLNASVALLQNEGYKVYYVKVPQLGTGKDTTQKVLTAPGVPYSVVYKNRDKISQLNQVTNYSEDGGRSFIKVYPPLSISSKRVGIRYAEEGGADSDGVIFVRPGVKDVSLGRARYAQVRVAVDGTHYLKGMAMYKDDLPPGVDLVFNTNKSNTGVKTDAMKSLKSDPDLPFGSIVRQITGGDNKPSSVMNIVNEEGAWEKWSKTLSSQFLSKQAPAFAKSQLDKGYQQKKEELDEILSLTNPAVKKKLLEAYADGADSSAVHLKAAAVPRTAQHVILPVNSLKDNEVYAPNYRNGEKVVLVRHPHGGVFELPELTVNNNHPESKKLLGRVPDAIGINAKVAEKLSGADFDGDTVLVIPNNNRLVKTAPSLAGLKNFDPKSEYPAYDGMKTMGGGTWDAKRKKEVYPEGKGPSGRTKGVEMGKISNLITDMTIKGATDSELARAVRHSMVVIDAEKHVLNYRQSARNNGIAALKAKYQTEPGKTKPGGAATLISRAGSELKVNERKQGYRVDPVTGKKIHTETGASYIGKNGEVVIKRTDSTKLAETDNAHTLSSGTTIEKVYADYSNNMKALANQARLAMVRTENAKISPSAKVTYKQEVESLNSKLAIAIRNRPLERQAQVIANGIVSQKRQANPDMEASELKKLKSQAQTEARLRVGAEKQRIQITDAEWNAIQAGAISTNKLNQILNNTDLDGVKKLATPKATVLMTSTKTQKAQVMLNAGYTQAEVADALGVSLSTLKATLGGEG